MLAPKWTPDRAARWVCGGRAQLFGSPAPSRNAEGDIPYACRNVRVNASCVSYPASKAIVVTEESPERSCEAARSRRSEEHTSELQSPVQLVCRLLLEKK